MLTKSWRTVILEKAFGDVCLARMNDSRDIGLMARTAIEDFLSETSEAWLLRLFDGKTVYCAF